MASEFDHAGQRLGWVILLYPYQNQKKHSPSRYRPVSIPSILGKILEKLFHSAAIYHSLSDIQWGISGVSTTTALLSIMQEWPRLLDQNNKICSVFFDLQKVFDSEPHKLLWKRLEGYSSVPQVGTQLHHTQLYPSQNCMQL